MPTILLIDGFRFFFYSNENNEPPHVHVTKGDGNGKIWLEPEILTTYMHNFTKTEERQITDIVIGHADIFLNKWYEYFGK